MDSVLIRLYFVLAIVLVVAAVTVVLSASKCGLLRAVDDVIGQSPRRWNSQLITCIITFFADMVGNVCIKNKKWERRRYSFVVLEMVPGRTTQSISAAACGWQITVQGEKNRLSQNYDMLCLAGSICYWLATSDVTGMRSTCLKCSQ